jgi:hypothetical protein
MARRYALGVVVAAVLASAAIAPAGAQTAPAGNAAPGAAGGATPAAAANTISLLAQDPWTPIGGNLRLRVLIPPEIATTGSTLSLVAYQPVESRAAYERLLDQPNQGAVLDQVSIPVADLPAEPGGARAVSVGVEGTTDARDPDRLSLRRTGVYPLAVDLLDDSQRSRASFVTMVVAVATDDAGAPVPLDTRLGVAWTWPLQTGPSTRPDGTTDPRVTDELRPSGRLGRQAVALTRAGDVPLTLAPGPETLEAWGRQGTTDPAIARGAAAVGDAAGRDQVITGTYVPTNLPSLLQAGLGTAVDAQLVRGDATLARTLGTRPDVRTAIAIPVDAASLARLRSGGVDRVVIDGDALASTNRGAPTRPFALQPPPSLIPSGSVSAVAGDTAIERLLQGDAPPALRAQRVLADLAVIALEDPRTPRAVTIVNPRTFDPPVTLIDALLTGLRGSPLLAPMTLDQVFTNVPAEGTPNNPAVRQLGSYSPPQPPVSTLAYGAARLHLDAFRSLVGPADDVVVAGERSLLVCESSTFDTPPGEVRAHATVASIKRSIDDFLAHIRVPHRSTITLTSRSGEIPLTFRNDTGKIIDVSLELNSSKLTFPEGASRAIRLPTRSTTLRIPVEARTSGTFPLHLSVTSTDGSLPVADSTLRVRSTAVSAVGIALMGGAVVFLVLWWGVHIRRNRRARRSA